MTIMTRSRREEILDKLAWFVSGTYIIFMLGFFFIPNAVDQYKFYGLAVFLPSLPLLPRFFRATGREPLLWLIIACLAWMLLSSLWSTPFSPDEFLKTLRLAVYIVIFVLITAYIAIQKPATSETTIALLGAGAAVAALISIPMWYSSHPFPGSRMIGIGTLENPNPSAFVYGFLALVSCQRALGYSRLFPRLFYGFSTILLLSLVFLTQSNTGILATLSSISLLLLLRHGGRLQHLAGGILAATGTLLFLLYSLGILEKPVDTGLSTRIPIWEKVIDQIEQAPLMGHGYQKQVLLDTKGSPDPANYAHNALLASFRDGGFIAASLHLLILATALAYAIKIFTCRKDPTYLAYLLLGFVCMLVDTDQLITRPRELWIIFWWPLAMIIAAKVTLGSVRNGSGDKPAE